MKDKEGQPIETGDQVETRFRGGKREGTVSRRNQRLVGCVLAVRHINISQVEQVVTGDKDAGQVKGVDVKNPPKVVFSDQVSALCRE